MTKPIVSSKIRRINDHFYQVESASGHRDYTVNPIARVCTCPDALYRGNKSCRHLRAVDEQIAAQPAAPKSAAEYQAEADERFARQQADEAIAAQNQRYQEAQEAARHELPSLVRDVPLTDAEAERVTGLERAARKAKRLKDEELRKFAAERNGTAAGAACLLELAARQIAWAKDAELKAIFS